MFNKEVEQNQDGRVGDLNRETDGALTIYNRLENNEFHILLSLSSLSFYSNLTHSLV